MFTKSASPVSEVKRRVSKLRLINLVGTFEFASRGAHLDLLDELVWFGLVSFRFVGFDAGRPLVSSTSFWGFRSNVPMN